MPDPDIEIRRGGLRKAGEGGVGALAPPLDPPLVYSLEHVLLTGEVLE